MNQNNPDLNKLMQMASGKTPEQLLKSLPPEQADKVRAILNDPQLTQKLLQSKQAQQLMKKMNGQGK